jgi:hypothetical protein
MTARARKPPDPLERDVQKTSVALLRSCGWVVLRRNTGAMRAVYKGRERLVRFSEKGASDLTGLMPPPPGWRWWRPFDAECKRLGERPTLDQARWLLARNELTGAAFWFDAPSVAERVARCLMAGGRVIYLDTTRRYGNAVGPSCDYDIEWPEPAGGPE